MANLIGEMVDISSNKKDLLDKLLDLTKRQANLISEDDFSSFDSLLGDKADIMEEIDRLDGKFLDRFNQLKEIEGLESLEDIDVKKYDNLSDLKNIISNLKETIEEIYKLDKDNMSFMAEEFDKVKLELRQVKDAKLAYKGYNYDQASSMMIDERK